MNTLHVGIDVSSKSNIVYFMLPNGEKHSDFSVANSHDGSTQLVKRILSDMTSHSLDTVVQQRGEQIPTQTCTRVNCSKTCAVSLSTAERQSSISLGRVDFSSAG